MFSLMTEEESLFVSKYTYDFLRNLLLVEFFDTGQSLLELYDLVAYNWREYIPKGCKYEEELKEVVTLFVLCFQRLCRYTLINDLYRVTILKVLDDSFYYFGRVKNSSGDYIWVNPDEYFVYVQIDCVYKEDYLFAEKVKYTSVRSISYKSFKDFEVYISNRYSVVMGIRYFYFKDREFKFSKEYEGFNKGDILYIPLILEEAISFKEFIASCQGEILLEYSTGFELLSRRYITSLD